MLLEHEIQQQKFKSPAQKLAVNIIYTNNWLSYFYESMFKNTGLTPQQYNVLRILRGQYPNACNLKLIRERMLDRMSDASRIVDKLKQKELIERRESETDRRNLSIHITERGLTLLKSLDHIDENVKKLFKNLSEDEQILLNDLLDRLRG
ncbi:MAG: MarR family transcriptional regulator [Sediminibacterium sp.]|nr:MarR family transcriptional regulator [Sediminibacterium sp.]